MPRRYRTARSVTVAILLLCAGCASSPLATARTSYAAARAVYDAAEERYRAEQEACVASDPQPDPCVAEVRQRWAPARKPADALRSALVALVDSLRVYDALSGAGRAPDPSAVQKAVREALDAAEALSEALASQGVR